MLLLLHIHTIVFVKVLSLVEHIETRCLSTDRPTRGRIELPFAAKKYTPHLIFNFVFIVYSMVMILSKVLNYRRFMMVYLTNFDFISTCSHISYIYMQMRGLYAWKVFVCGS